MSPLSEALLRCKANLNECIETHQETSAVSIAVVSAFGLVVIVVSIWAGISSSRAAKFDKKNHALELELRETRVRLDVLGKMQPPH